MRVAVAIAQAVAGLRVRCDSMPIYSGNTFKRFLIDRYAMGFPAEAIMHEFKAVQGIDITEAEVEEILKDSNDEIHKREIELMKELSNHNVIGTLYNIQTQLNEARDIAKVKGDMKTYAQLTNTLLSSIEVLIKLAQNFKEREQNKIKGEEKWEHLRYQKKHMEK